MLALGPAGKAMLSLLATCHFEQACYSSWGCAVPSRSDGTAVQALVGEPDVALGNRGNTATVGRMGVFRRLGHCFTIPTADPARGDNRARCGDPGGIRRQSA